MRERVERGGCVRGIDMRERVERGGCVRGIEGEGEGREGRMC